MPFLGHSPLLLGKPPPRRAKLAHQPATSAPCSGGTCHARWGALPVEQGSALYSHSQCLSAVPLLSFMDCAGAAPAVLYYVVVAGFLGTLSVRTTCAPHALHHALHHVHRVHASL